ncbi:hypothetical protein ACFQ4N_12910 [Oceanobacillus iheyensis]|uniref:Uncharacterized protein n=1 Tax=Oceanobacillus iheyensis (strain DSM 14371 / CIP 107618 / JCM 11309 / KCTC 3954 / HTE831) TaxID=221109 RepID=Q8ELX8_OCEIH|nr:hypothetical protein [Oceanobacillus iheyensis]BAC15042.1 hypothetical protein [Oceanobacillus iheyensis HTE831]
MNQQVKRLIEDTKNKWNLSTYTLESHSFFQEKMDSNELGFVLSMTWKLNGSIENADELSTINIDLNVDNGNVRRILFTNYNNNLEETLFPDMDDIEDIIEWIETQSTLEFGRQFTLVDQSETELLFQASVDNISVFPSGSIQIKFNEDGKLVHFSVDGVFPDESQLDWEPFALTSDITKPIAEDQIQLIEIPSEDKEAWIPIFVVSSVFITNDGKKTISYNEVERPKSYINKDTVLRWTEPKEGTLQPVNLEPKLEYSEAEVFSQVDVMNNDLPISTEDQLSLTEGIIEFLQQNYPQDSGKWRLTGVWRDAGYIFGQVLPVEKDSKVIEHKINVVFDSQTLDVLNYVDTESLLNMYDFLSPAETPTLTEEQAAEKLVPNVDISPVYVYDKSTSRYCLCGKLDSNFGVHAVTGELVSLDEL